MQKKTMTVISLFSGAGGLDVGFIRTGFEILWANDFDKDACETYRKNIGNHIVCGKLENSMHELDSYKNVDLVIGGPPCQGFSVAGKMNPNDIRSKMIWSFLDVVEKVKPKAFVMENVKALGVLSKWEDVRKQFLDRANHMGYKTTFIILKASDYSTPQNRERVFFIGFKNDQVNINEFHKLIQKYAKPGKKLREVLLSIDKAGEGNNKETCSARVTLATNPILRKSPYAGMLFNGAGRPLKLDGYATTLPASMGGNKTPIIDEDELYLGKDSWVENYHKKIMNGEKPPEDKDAPSRLRRITIKEAQLIQTFPRDYKWSGKQSSIYKQIGNAVPCNMAEAVASFVRDTLNTL